MARLARLVRMGRCFPGSTNDGTDPRIVGLARLPRPVSFCISSQRTSGGMRTVVLAATSVIIAACGREQASPELAAMADSAGVTIVSNSHAQWSGDEAWSLSTEPRLILGVLDGAPEYQFSDISSAARQVDGDLVVADVGMQSVRLFDAAGRFVQRLGGPGSGPGEFQLPTQVLLREPDSILVWDDAAYRLTRFDSSGNFIDIRTFSREKIAKSISPPLYPGTAKVLNSSEILVRLIEKGKDDPAKDRIRGRSGALRVSFDTVVIDTVAWFGDVEQVLVDAPWGRQPVVPPLARNSSIAVHPGGGRLCIGDQNRPEVRCFEEDGRSTSVKWAANPPPVREFDPDVALWREATLELYESKLTAGEARRLVDQVAIPAVRPEYSDLILDSEGNLWVELGPGERGVAYLVFDSAGELHGELAMPPMRVLEIGSDYVLGVVRDELQVQSLQMFKIDKPPRSVDGGSQ